MLGQSLRSGRMAWRSGPRQAPGSLRGRPAVAGRQLSVSVSAAKKKGGAKTTGGGAAFGTGWEGGTSGAGLSWPGLGLGVGVRPIRQKACSKLQHGNT